MNIFILDTDTELCAQYHCDKHVVKMITEHAQMLSTAVRTVGFDAGYKVTHLNHPCSKWVRYSIDNWLWLFTLTFRLHEEWQYRYNHPYDKIHKSWEIARNLPIPTDLPSCGITPFALAMPNEYKSENPVESYRNYYFGDKQHIASWKKRGEPEWFTERKINIDNNG